MYTFTLSDHHGNTNLAKERDNQFFVETFEFADTIRSGDALNKNKLKEIKKSKLEIVLPKPRNKFMIFRGLVKKAITLETPINDFSNISRLYSFIWTKRTKMFDKYVGYLAKQEGEYYKRRFNLLLKTDKTKQKKRKEPLMKTCVEAMLKHNLEQPTSKDRFRYFNGNNKRKRLENIFIKKRSVDLVGPSRIEDVYINNYSTV